MWQDVVYVVEGGVDIKVQYVVLDVWVVFGYWFVDIGVGVGVEDIEMFGKL